ncbi:unnamed protein product [Rhizophagus irregularis]|nr:unnamed protein product [Rhizophagus irregularis]
MDQSINSNNTPLSHPLIDLSNYTYPPIDLSNDPSLSYSSIDLSNYTSLSYPPIDLSNDPSLSYSSIESSNYTSLSYPPIDLSNDPSLSYSSIESSNYASLSYLPIDLSNNTSTNYDSPNNISLSHSTIDTSLNHSQIDLSNNTSLSRTPINLLDNTWDLSPVCKKVQVQESTSLSYPTRGTLKLKAKRSTWIDGPMSDNKWDEEKQEFERLGEMIVALKELNNSNNIDPKELNELKIFYNFIIKGTTSIALHGYPPIDLSNDPSLSYSSIESSNYTSLSYPPIDLSNDPSLSYSSIESSNYASLSYLPIDLSNNTSTNYDSPNNISLSHSTIDTSLNHSQIDLSNNTSLSRTPINLLDNTWDLSPVCKKVQVQESTSLSYPTRGTLKLKAKRSTWIDGPMSDNKWDEEKQEFERLGEMIVALKELNNSNNIDPKELNELKIFYNFIIKGTTSSRRPFWDKSHDTDLIIEICDGLRPPIVTNAPEGYIELMQNCWHSDPNKRPTADDIWMKFCYVTSKLYYGKERYNQTKIINSPDIGPITNNPGAIYKSRPLSTMIKSVKLTKSLKIQSTIQELDNSVKKFKLCEDKRDDYLSKELKFDINDNINSNKPNINNSYTSKELNFDI